MLSPLPYQTAPVPRSIRGLLLCNCNLSTCFGCHCNNATLSMLNRGCAQILSFTFQNGECICNVSYTFLSCTLSQRVCSWTCLLQIQGTQHLNLMSLASGDWCPHCDSDQNTNTPWAFCICHPCVRFWRHQALGVQQTAVWLSTKISLGECDAFVHVWTPKYVSLWFMDMHAQQKCCQILHHLGQVFGDRGLDDSWEKYDSICACTRGLLVRTPFCFSPHRLRCFPSYHP